MLRLEFFLVAESVSVDRETNQLSIFNVYEECLAPGIPLLIAPIVIVAVWRVEDGDAEQDWQALIRMRIPGSGAGAPAELPVNFRPGRHVKRHRLFWRLDAIGVTQEGTIEFELLLNGTHVAEHAIPVRTNLGIPRAIPTPSTAPQ